MVSEPVTPGDITTTSTDVTVNVNDAESYTLRLSVDSTTITNGHDNSNGESGSSTSDGNNTLTAGNPNDSNSTNVWGYKWDNASTYTAPTIAGTILTSSTNPSSNDTKLNSTNGSTSFTKTLTFGAKFSSNANAGTYHGSGTLSLVATPVIVAIGYWELADGSTKDSDITTMQEMTPAICNQMDDPGANASYDKLPKMRLIDSRDKNVYFIAKMQDNKCWMINNLHLRLSNNTKLTASDTNIPSDWTPTNNTLTSLSASNFSSRNYRVESYIATPNDSAGETGYYSFTAATAGWATTSVTSGNSSQSICPKGWRLPTGTFSGEFQNLFAVGGISDNSGSLWQYTGYTYALADIRYPSSYGGWWANTVYDGDSAYSMYISDGTINPAYDDGDRYCGLAIRCIADTRFTYSITYKFGNGYSQWASYTLPATQTINSEATQVTLTLSSERPLVSNTGGGSAASLMEWLGDDGKVYNPGESVILTADKPTLILVPNKIGGTSVGC